MKQRTSRRVSAAVAATVLATLLPSCTLFDPYVRASKLDAPSAHWGQGAVRLDHVVDAAIAQRTLYYQAVSERAKLRNGLPLVLIPISAVALRRGITATTEGGRGVVLDLGITAAGIYGFSGYYLGAPRERIYLAGALALSCTIRAIEPYLIDSKQFSASVAALEAKADQVAGVAERIDTTLARTPSTLHSTETFRLARSEPRVADAVIRRARRVASSARKLEGDIVGAARNMRWAVERVVSQVNTQVEATEPDPSSILRIVGSLKAIGAQFAPPPGAAPTTTAPVTTGAAQTSGVDPAARVEADRAITEMTALLSELKTTTNDLIELTNGVNAHVQTATASIKSAATDLDACTVPTVGLELQLSPDGETHDLRPTQTIQFDIRSNVGIPSASLVGVVRGAGKTKDAAEIGKVVDGNVFRARITYVEEQAGLDDVTVEFCANEKCAVRKQVKLNLLKTTPATPAAPTQTVPAVPVTPAPTVPVVPVTPAPTTPAPTVPAAPPAQKQATAPGTGDAKIGPSGANNTYERRVLTVGALKRVQEKLRVTPTGALDRQTRTGIRQFQDLERTEVDGALSEALVAKILG